MAGKPAASHVFISYAREDMCHVERLRASLRQAHILYWIDKEGLQPGNPNWEKAIRTAIKQASGVIYVASPNALESPFVRDEIMIAEVSGRPVYPLWVDGEHWIESVKMGMGATQYADARGTKYESGVADLLRALHGQFPALAVRTQVVSPLPPGVPRRNPYKGLETFREKDRRDFFGRTSTIEALMRQLRRRAQGNRERMVTVIGPSGSGKSSVVMAGLLPRLRLGEIPGSESWIFVAPFTPGNAPVMSLARELHKVFTNRTRASIDEELMHQSGLGLVRLADALDNPMLLVIDQFEELFMPNVSEDERQQFISLLVSAVNDERKRVVVILTMRADYYDRPMNYRELGVLVSKHQHSILPMSLEEVRDAIEGPARLPDVALEFEKGLVGEIIFDLRDQKDKGVLAGALPLLQFTLQQLFAECDRNRLLPRLTLKAYGAIGRVDGAIGSHAESLYNSLDTSVQKAWGRVFMTLITVDETGDSARKRAPAMQFRNDAAARKLIEALVDGRLLIWEGEGRKAEVSVAHEALLRSWKRLADWTRETADDIRLLQKVVIAAEEWDKAERPDRKLWHHEDLQDVYRARERLGVTFSPLAEEFTKSELDRLLSAFPHVPYYQQMVMIERFTEIGEAAVPYLIQAVPFADPEMGHIKDFIPLLWRFPRQTAAYLRQAMRSDERELQLAAALVQAEIALVGAGPDLRRLASEGPGRYVRQAAIVALGQLNDADAADAILPNLAAPETELRLTAVRTLGALKAERAARKLIALLSDPDEALQLATVEALGHIGGASAAGALIQLATRGLSPALREAVVTALGALKATQSIPILIKSLQNPDARARQTAKRALTGFDSALLVEPLLRLLDSPPAEIRVVAVELLANATDRRVTGILLSKLEDPDESVRVAAVAALGRRGGSRVVSTLLDLVDSRSKLIARSAATALGELKASAAVDTLISMLDTRDDMLRCAVAQALGNIGDNRAVIVLTELLAGSRPSVRAVAASALGELSGEVAVSALLAQLRKERVKDVKRQVIVSLGKLRAVSAAGNLLACLRSDDVEIRVAVCDALARIGSPVAVTNLMALLKHEDSKVVVAALRALGQIGELSDTGPLVDKLTDMRDDVREAAATALCRQASPAQAERIRHLSGHPFLHLQALAVGILAQIHFQQGAGQDATEQPSAPSP